MFYDQFGRLAPYQIALVSIGVAILLIGVWVVSVIQPTGQGGVDVGTWAEEEEEEGEEDEDTPFLGDERVEEPDPLDDPSSIITHAITHAPPPSIFVPAVVPESTPPTSPMSPTTRAHFRHRGPRYGTLIPELVHPGAPTGFSLGLGAASPGFVLRPGSMSMHVNAARLGRADRGMPRSRSEGVEGIQAIMRGHEEEVREVARGTGADETGEEGDVPVVRGGWVGKWWRERREKRGEGKIKLRDNVEGG